MSYEFYLGQGFILIIPHRAADTLIITDMMTLSDDFHPVMYRVVTKDDTEYLPHRKKTFKEPSFILIQTIIYIQYIQYMIPNELY